MTLEARIRDELMAQRDGLPAPEDTYASVIKRGRRRSIRRRTRIGLATGVAFVLAVSAAIQVLPDSPAVAASPTTGQELMVINETPLVLQGTLGPAPDSPPIGTDLTFTQIETPSETDLAAINQTIEQQGYTEPVVVALGEIEGTQTRVYQIHNVSTDTRVGRSSVIAVGPDYPNFASYHGPTNQRRWGPGISRDLDGDGWIVMGIPASASYVQVDVDGDVSWQRPSDGVIWLPYSAASNQDVLITGYDVPGRVFYEQAIDAQMIDSMIEQAE